MRSVPTAGGVVASRTQGASCTRTRSAAQGRCADLPRDKHSPSANAIQPARMLPAAGRVQLSHAEKVSEPEALSHKFRPTPTHRKQQQAKQQRAQLRRSRASVADCVLSRAAVWRWQSQLQASELLGCNSVFAGLLAHSKAMQVHTGLQTAVCPLTTHDPLFTTV